MKKMVTKISAAALSAAMVLGSSAVLSAGAEGEDAAVSTTTAAEISTSTETTTTVAETVLTTSTAAVTEAAATTSTAAATEAATAAASTTTQPAAVTMNNLAGKWEYQVSSGNDTVDKGAKSNGTVEIKADGTFTYTNAENKTSTGTVKIESEEIGGTSVTFINFYIGSEVSFGGAYFSANAISIGNGGMSRLVRITDNAAATTQAVTTTAKANTNDSPKTGDTFPALAMTAALLSAAALSISTKKRNK